MNGLSHPFVALGLLSTGAALAIAAFTWAQRGTQGSQTYTGLMTVLAAWSTLYAGQLLEPTVATKAEWFIARHALNPLIGVMFWVFAARYTDREELLTGRYLGPILAGGALLSLSTLVNPAGLYWMPVGLIQSGSITLLEYSIGPLLWTGILYLLCVVGGGHLVIVGMFKQTFAAYRPQLLAMTVVGLIEFTLAVLFLSDHISLLPSLNPWPYVQLTTYGATIVALPLGWSYFNDALFDIQPLARQTVIENMDDAVFVVDKTGIVRFTNPQANQLLELGSEETVESRPAKRVFEAQPTLLSWYATVTDASETTDREQTASMTCQIEDGTKQFDLRASEISNSVDEVTGVVIVARDVTEMRKRSEQLRERTAELKRRTKQLEEQNARLDRFGSFVSHDLRNPIQVASGYIEITRETGDETHLAKADDAIERMSRMITDLRDLTGVDQSTLDLTSVEIKLLAKRAWETVDTGAARLMIDDNPVVQADKEYLLHIFENLITNSVDHGTPESDERGGGLTINVGTLPHCAGFYIEDDGVGIPEDIRDSILEHGYTTSSEGTGLGMSIVQTIADAHGWEITVTESESGGTRFEFTGVGEMATATGQ